MPDDLSLELAKIFCECWNLWIEGPSEELQSIMENTPLVEEKTATAEDVDGGDLPEGCEEGDTYYTLSPLGRAAWTLVFPDEEKDAT